MPVSIDAVGTVSILPNTSITTYTGITVGSLADRALVVTLMFDSVSVSGVTATWDSGGSNQPMELIASLPGYLYIFCLVNPTPGNKTLNFLWFGGTTGVAVDAISFIGVDQTGGATSFKANSNTGNSAVASLPVSSAVGNWVVALFAGGNIVTPTDGTTMYSDTTLASPSAASDITGSASVNLTASVAPSGIWDIIGVDVVAAASNPSNNSMLSMGI
jgi:hypothetical protein